MIEWHDQKLFPNEQSLPSSFDTVENSFDVSDTEKTRNAFIPFKRKGENRGFDAMGYIQFPVLDTILPLFCRENFMG